MKILHILQRANSHILTLSLLEPKLMGWRQEECGRLSNLAKYLDCCVLTIIHSKQWHLRRWRIKALPDAELVLRLLKEMIEIGGNDKYEGMCWACWQKRIQSQNK